MQLNNLTEDEKNRAKHFDQLSEDYDQEVSWRSDLELLKFFIDNKPPSEKLVADLGCGTGVLSKMISKEFYFGFDLSLGMLRKASKNNRNFIRANVLSLPITNQSFDNIWARQVLQYVDMDSFMSESYRISKPQSTLLTQHFTVLDESGILWWKKFKDHLQPHRKFLFTENDIERSAKHAGWELSSKQHTFHEREIDLNKVAFKSTDETHKKSDFLDWVQATHHDQVPDNQFRLSGSTINLKQRWSSLKFIKNC